MPLRTILVVAVAIVSAGVTGVLAHNWLATQRSAFAANQTQSSDPGLDLVKVLVATEDLAVGAFVQADLLTWAPWPESALRDVYAVSGESQPEDFAGAVVRTRILAGEPLNTSRLVQPGERGFLSAVLRPGYRAVSVPVDDASGIAGFVFPGDRVDVLFTYRIESRNESSALGPTRHYSRTLLSRVRVLAVDQTVDNADGAAMPASTVTLEVDRKQAEKLALSMDLGSLSLSLRSLTTQVADASAATGDAGGSVAKEQHQDNSITRDLDVMYILDSNPTDSEASSRQRPVDVLHGVKAEQVLF